MNAGTKLTATTMQSLRRCVHRSNKTSIKYRQQKPSPAVVAPRSISSSSTNNSGARASQASAAGAVTSWKIHGSSIVARKSIVINPSVNWTAVNQVVKPSWSEFKNLFATSALPMVGFGFMDNFIMIQAGGYIDSTLGVKFGLATLTAAAMGQVVSDVSGVLFGSTVDSCITRLGLVKPSNMSPAQRQLPLSRRVSLAGAVIGVIIGCCLGATSLYFVPHQHNNHSESKQRMEKMKGILKSMLGDNDIGCDECTMYLVEGCVERETSENTAESSNTIDRMQIHIRPMGNPDESSLHQQSACDGATIISRNGRQRICTPIYDKKKSLLGVMEFSIKKQPASNSFDRTFGEREERLAQVTARHLGAILDHCF